jgi:hypothetical protein
MEEETTETGDKGDRRQGGGRKGGREEGKMRR